jgi:uncharacterized membrane protein YfcA
VTFLLLAGVVSGLAAGLLAGSFGVGGGIVLVPALGLLLGLSQHQAQGVTLAVLLLPIGLPAVLAYLRVVTIRWWLVAALVAGFVAGVGGGALLANVVPERPMRALFVVFLVVVAVRSLRGSGARRKALAADGSHALPPAWHGLWIGALAGVLSGLLGIGGGIVMVPLLVAFLALEQREAQATSLATMLPPVGLPGVLVYAKAQGGLPWVLVAAVVGGFAVGGFLGARVASRASAATMGRAFAVFVLCIAAAMTWRLVMT